MEELFDNTVYWKYRQFSHAKSSRSELIAKQCAKLLVGCPTAETFISNFKEAMKRERSGNSMRMEYTYTMNIRPATRNSCLELWHHAPTGECDRLVLEFEKLTPLKPKK